MKKFIVFGLLASKIVFGATITVAAAADLRFVLQDLTALYEKEYPQDKLKFIYGASGNFYNQIRAGYPIDVFMSADTHFPELLYKQGLSYKPRAYAVGKLALFTTKNIDVDNPKLAFLKAQKVAIASPRVAPYGVAGISTLHCYHVYNDVKDKIIFGENIIQTTQFVASKNADVGLVSYSLILAPQLHSKGKFYLIPQACYKPIVQSAAVIKATKDKNAAMRFFNFLYSQEAIAIWKSFGYGIPR